MAFGNVNSVSAAKSTTKSTPYGTLKGFISPYNSGSSKLCEGGTTIGQNVKSIKIKIFIIFFLLSFFIISSLSKVSI